MSDISSHILGTWNRACLASSSLGLIRKYRAAIFYTFASVVVSLSQVVSTFAVLNVISPEDLGLWNSVKLAITYSFFVLSGVVNGLSRELPFYLGKGDEKSAESLSSTSLFYILVISLLVPIIGLVFLLGAGGKDTKIETAICSVTILIVFGFYSNYLLVTFRSKSSFNKLTIIRFVESILTIATLPLLYYFYYNGLLVRAVLSGGMLLLLLHLIRPMKVSPKWDRQAFLLLIKTGSPIFILDYIRSCASTFDRLAVLHFSGVKEVGYYAMAGSAYEMLCVVPVSLAQYVYPRMSFSFGNAKDTDALWGIAWKSSAATLVLLLPAAILGWWLLPPVVARLFPKYLEGVGAAQISLFSAAFFSINVGVNALWSMKAWKYIVTYQLSRTALLVIGPLIGALSFSPIIEGVALGVLAAHLVSFALGLIITYSATHNQPLTASTP